MQPLIKWPGGKSKEFVYIEKLIPPFKRYIEPFFGGGAIYFALQPKNAVINDICSELISFYENIKNSEKKDKFKKELYLYADNWEKIPNYLEIFKDELNNIFFKLKEEKINKANLKFEIEKILFEKENLFNGLFDENFCLDRKNLLKEISSNLNSKIQRTVDIEKKRGTLPKGDLEKNIETAFRSGFYMHFRDVMNHHETKYKISKEKIIANYYFIREFCYGSMFRFNSSGKFNIPYGGIAYNSKNFRGKLDYIFSKEVHELFKNTIIKNDDFEKIFNDLNLDNNDFIFLDPPYDSDFSDYEKKEFGKKDQERLAKILYSLKAKFILIIKKTPLIYDLYSNKDGITIEKFEKTYLYNVKGRNDREVEHLVIYNF